MSVVDVIRCFASNLSILMRRETHKHGEFAKVSRGELNNYWAGPSAPRKNHYYCLSRVCLSTSGK